MKKVMKILVAILLMGMVVLTGCSNDGASKDTNTKTSKDSTSKDDPKIAFIVAGKLGDQAFNDASYAGVVKFTEETGIEVTTIEVAEFQDNEINARNFAQNGYDLVLLGTNATSDIIPPIAEEYPETTFVIYEGTVDGIDNVSSLQSRVAEAGFLSGAYCALMNNEIAGNKVSAFIGGKRNPSLERARHSFTAGSEYVGGKATTVYVGSFSDVAKGKEIALQLFNLDIRVIQAYAGGSGVGVYQAAESLGEGYFSMGAANGQFDLSDTIIASLVKQVESITYSACKNFVDGTLESGITNVGLKEGVVDVKLSPKNESFTPQSVKDEIDELRQKIINGEIVPPSSEKEYEEFAAKYLTK